MVYQSASMVAALCTLRTWKLPYSLRFFQECFIQILPPCLPLPEKQSGIRCTSVLARKCILPSFSWIAAISPWVSVSWEKMVTERMYSCVTCMCMCSHHQVLVPRTRRWSTRITGLKILDNMTLKTLLLRALKLYLIPPWGLLHHRHRVHLGVVYDDPLSLKVSCSLLRASEIVGFIMFDILCRRCNWLSVASWICRRE